MEDSLYMKLVGRSPPGQETRRPCVLAGEALNAEPSYLTTHYIACSEEARAKNVGTGRERYRDSHLGHTDWLAHLSSGSVAEVKQKGKNPLCIGTMQTPVAIFSTRNLARTDRKRNQHVKPHSRQSAGRDLCLNGEENCKHEDVN